ncbi:bifunctional DNA primase/polymerase [Streptomyces sp. NPDC060194]|uniref:bifunctional DNA primase/polymerase n=1 Tax=Streptomyces sp. NPDC060194 TaxID=3347069 RepID=UPI00364A4ACD
MPAHGDDSATAPSGAVRAHDVARWCAAQGWPVHPLAPGRKTPAANCPACREPGHQAEDCPCRAAGRWCHGFRAATTDPGLIDAWWGAQPSLGVGVACGPADLVVLDVDAHSADVPSRDRLLPGIPIHEKVDLTGLASGYDTLALLAAYLGETDPAEDGTTLRVRTPSGGLHIWYRNPDPGTRYRSSTGSGPRTALAWQVDVRADHGYIVAPANRVPKGTYSPVGDVRLPAPLPAWLARELARTGHVLTAPQSTATPPPTAPQPSNAPQGAYGPFSPTSRPSGPRRAPRAAERLLGPLLAEVEACAAVPEGASFTEKLNRAAYTAGGVVAAGHLTERQARALLDEAARTARPHQLRRSATIIESALAAGATRPFHPQGRP